MQGSASFMLQYGKLSILYLVVDYGQDVDDVVVVLSVVSFTVED